MSCGVRPNTRPKAELEALRQRVAGTARNGTVFLEDYNRGISDTLGATVQAVPGIKGKYRFVTVAGVDPPEGLPGVPVIFSYAEDVFEKYRLPLILIRWDDANPAPERRHPGTTSYQVPAKGSLPVGVGGRVGYPRVETRGQAEPYDLTYTIVVLARHRGIPGGQRNQSHRVIFHVMQRFPMFSSLCVRDSVGDLRTYEAVVEGLTPEDEIFDVADRTIGHSLSLKIMGELDLSEPFESRLVTSLPEVHTAQR